MSLRHVQHHSVVLAHIFKWTYHTDNTVVNIVDFIATLSFSYFECFVFLLLLLFIYLFYEIYVYI